jgi:integrase
VDLIALTLRPIRTGSKKTYNNAISALRRAFAFGFKDYPEARDSGASERPCVPVFTGLRPSEQIAFIVSDYDRVNGVLSIAKGRVHSIERGATKTGEDRRIELCPQAIAILDSHLTWRDSLVRQGHILHDALFFTLDCDPGGASQRPPW